MTAKHTPKGKKSFAYIVLYFYMILLLLVLLTVASYTWFNISQTPRVSNMAMYINAMAGMDFSVSPQGGEWGKQLSFSDLLKFFPSHSGLLPLPKLLPVLQPSLDRKCSVFRHVFGCPSADPADRNGFDSRILPQSHPDHRVFWQRISIN